MLNALFKRQSPAGLSLSAICLLLLSGCGGSGSGPDTEINRPNQVPVADAGSSQSVLEGAQVVLSGSGQDNDGNIVSYQWTQTAGPEVTLTGGNSATAQFTAPVVEDDLTMMFRLMVTDDKGATAVDDVDVSVAIASLASQLALSDDNLSACIVNQAALKGWKRVSHITNLNCSGLNIADIGGIDSLTGLSVLQLSDNQISDLNPLSSMSGLTELDLSNNAISQIEPLHSLVNIQNISLNGNGQIRCEDVWSLILTLGYETIVAPESCNFANSPSVNAGTDQYKFSLADVALFGKADESIGEVSYQWQQIGGTAVTLKNSHHKIAEFTAPEVSAEQVLSFALTVVDASGEAHTDITQVTISPDGPADEVVFESDRMQNCYNWAISSNQWSMLSEVTVLNCDNLAATTLNGIEKLKSLIHLDMHGSLALKDISALRTLSSIQTLDFDRTGLLSTSGLGGKPQLRELRMAWAFERTAQREVDFSVLASSTNALKTLNLESNALKDSEIAGLAEVTALVELNLTDNQITDMTPLAHMANLKTLKMGENQVAGLPELSEMKVLESLYLYDNQIVDMTPVTQLSHLSLLGIGGNNIVDIPPLDNMLGLQELYISGNQIVDIDALNNQHQIKRLGLGNNQIVDIEVLGHLTGLVYLGLSDNPLSDISPLYHLVNAELISLWRVGSITCDALYALQNALEPGVVSFDPDSCPPDGGNAIESIDFTDDNLKTCVMESAQANGWQTIGEMTHLNCRSKDILYLDGLKDLVALTELDLADNPFIDIEYLQRLPWLTKLNLQQNDHLVCSQLDELNDAMSSDDALIMPAECWRPDNVSTIIASFLPDDRLSFCYSHDTYVQKIHTVDKVRNINCHNGYIFNIEGIDKAMPWGDKLVLSQNSISDLTPLSSLTYLTELSLSDNEVSNIEALATLGYLQRLALQNNSITDIETLFALKSLQWVDLKGNDGIRCDAIERLVSEHPSLTEVVRPDNCVQ